MNKELWKKIESLIVKCEAIAPLQVHNFLIKETNNNVELIEQVERYLSFSENSESLFANIVGNAVESTIKLSEQGAPERIGAYRIKKKIAQGGIGCVYLAARDDDIYDKDVVIKIVDGILSTQHKYRFQQERKILAKLQHPNIAQIVDAGSVNTDQHFLIMEYIEGENIDDYCSLHQLSLKARIKLFIDVCKAVQFAHRNLVVHRDIKPSNVMIDNRGTVKLLDFGIAKMLAADEVIGDALTKTHMRLMTPNYASPEQVRGEEVTTASDLYSLGALLYEIIVGTAPLVFKRNTAAEIEQTICEVTPKKISSVFKEQQLNPLAQEAKSKQGFVYDLDNILHKTLRKEIENRYQSVNHLIDDLENLLNNRPVNATPISKTYLIKKYIKRNIWKSAFMAFAAVSLTVILLSQYFNNIQLAKEKAQALAQAEIAKQTSKYLTRLIETADPEYFQGREITVLEALDQGVTALLENDALDGNVKSHLLLVLSRVYRNRSESIKGLELLEFAIRQRELWDNGRPSLELGQIINEYGDTLRQNFQLEKSFIQFGKAISILLQLKTDKKFKELANVYNNSGIAYTQHGQYQQAETVLNKAIDLIPELKAPRSTYLYNLARLFLIQKKPNKALQNYQKSYKIKLNIFGKKHRRTLNTLQGIMLTEKELGNYSDAISRAEFLLEQRIKLYGEPNLLVDITKKYLMELYFQSRQTNKANEIYSYLLAKSYDQNNKMLTGIFLPSLARVKEIKNDKATALRFWNDYKHFLLKNQPSRIRSIDQAEFNRVRLSIAVNDGFNNNEDIKKLTTKFKAYYPQSSYEYFQADFLQATLLYRQNNYADCHKLIKNSFTRLDPEIKSPIIEQAKKLLKVTKPSS